MFDSNHGPFRSSGVKARSLFTLLLAFGASACVPKLPGGGAREPNIEVPGSYGDIGATSGGEAAAESSATVDWHSFFADPNLVALVDEALANNQELNIAIQEILITNNEDMARRGDIQPSVGFGATAGIERVGEHTSQGQSDELTGLPADLQYYSLGLYASWEVDIWRRLRNLRDAAINRYLASVEGRNFMVTRVVAEIAMTYYELMALDQQLEVIQTTIELQQQSVDVAHIQFTAAEVTAVAVSRLEAEVRRYEAQEFEIRQRIVETENRLNFLVGRFPQPIARDSGTFLEREPPSVNAGLPGQLLENRPDIRQAELELEATRYDVRAARARFFPALSLEAGAGYASTSIRSLFATPASLLYSIVGNLAAPLLNRRGITAAYFTADATQMRAVLVYEKAILSGYIEVVNRMNLIENLNQSFELREQQVDQLHRAIELSTQLFNAARADYLEVLTARRDALEAQIDLIETKQRQLSAAIQLYQALGGGWRGAPSTTPVSEPGRRQGRQNSETNGPQ
jgi:NodT family efflux transporter outer membrane factor (OMF) lipoprotein